MNKRLKRLTSHFSRLTSLLLVIFCVLLAGCSSENKQQTGDTVQADSLPHDPYSAPLHAASQKSELADFETPLLDGKPFQLSEQRGKVVLLNIWATWCGPCEEETPELVDLYEEYEGSEVEFLGISIDEQGESVVEPFVNEYSVNYPMTIDDGSIMDKYGPLMGVPTTYLVDREGNLRYFATGAVTRAELKPRIDKLLAE